MYQRVIRLSTCVVPPQGLSFLDLRYHLLLFYLQDLTHLISIKAEGQKIKGSEALTRIVAVRTVRRGRRSRRPEAAVRHRASFPLCRHPKVLEKMRPMDHKLKYQIDKLVRTAVAGSLGETRWRRLGGPRAV